MRTCAAKKNKAFTLIEMLVVIAIIAILASLMMPALQGALDSARQVSCLNNLRNLGFGVQGYMDDNHTWFPSSTRWWKADLSSHEQNVYKVRNGIMGYLGGEKEGRELTKACPDHPMFGEGFTYAFNEKLGGEYAYPPRTPRRRQVRLKYPQTTICLIDSRGSSTYVVWDDNCYGKTRHNWRPSMLFADMHVGFEDNIVIYKNSRYWRADEK